METVEKWAHENIEGAENDEIECNWNGSIMTLLVNNDAVKEIDFCSIPDSAELRLSFEIDTVNHYYAYCL